MLRLGRHSSRLGFAMAALILAAVGGWVVVGAQRFIADATWVGQTHEVINQLEKVTALRREVISAQRGYLLTRRTQDREDFWQAKARVRQELHQLEALVADNPEQHEAIAQLAPLIDQRLAKVQHTVEVFEANGLAAAQEAIRTNGSAALDTRIDATVTRMLGRERSLLTMRNDVSRRSANSLLLGAALGIPLSLLILATIYAMLEKENMQRRRSEAAAGMATLELGRSVSQLQRVSGEMEALSRYAGMLQGCIDIAELLQVTRTSLRAMLPDAAVTLYLVRASGDHAEIAATWGTHRVESKPNPHPSDCWAVRRNQPFACTDAHRDLHCAHVIAAVAGPPVATHCLPVSAQGELMGWFYLSGPGPGPLRDAVLAQQAAEQFSLALANLRLKDVLRQQSIRDPLTGLFNRRYLEESLAREIARCQRRELPLAVIMLDLDHFKAFNDRHGHGGGDALLTAFARVLQANCRAEDIPCRYGGEEFTMILPEADDLLAEQRADALLRDTANLVVDFQGEHLSRVTASIGIASLPRHGTSATALLGAADAALYQAKAGGRNRAVVAALTG
ncbi:MAG: sensor domain-containing diguanylate cyclase [Arenimonas sp.]